MKTESSRWRGVAVLAPGMLTYVGPLGRTDLHAHHAVQIVIARDQPYALGDGSAAVGFGIGALIPANTKHAVAHDHASALVVYVDPDGDAGCRLAAACGAAGVSDWFRAGSQLGPLGAALDARDPAALIALSRASVEALVGSTTARADPHPAVRSLLAELPKRLDADVRIGALARLVGLSAGRLGHLFSEQVGLPIRRYIVWLRLQRALEAVRAGSTWTTAAHTAGFSDSASALTKMDQAALTRMDPGSMTKITRGSAMPVA